MADMEPQIRRTKDGFEFIVPPPVSVPDDITPEQVQAYIRNRYGRLDTMIAEEGFRAAYHRDDVWRICLEAELAEMFREFR
jgi:hypothetical protein